MFAENLIKDSQRLFFIFYEKLYAWEKKCDNPHQMISSFRDVGISLNIDGSEDDQMKFQGRPQGLPSDIVIS